MEMNRVDAKGGILMQIKRMIQINVEMKGWMTF